jgi:integrase
MAKSLTALAVKNAKPGTVRREIADGGCRGLYLVVFPNGSRSWVWRYRFQGKPKKLTIGPVYMGEDEIAEPALDCPNTLAGARRLAGDAALLLARGADPAAAKLSDRDAARLAAADAEAANGLTVSVLAKRFIRDHSMQRTRASSWQQTARLLGLRLDGDGALTRSKTGGEVLSKWGDRPAHAIARSDVNDLLRAIVARGAPITSNRVLAAVRKMFNWAVAEDILAASPCVGVTRKADDQSRDRILSDAELRLVWKAADALGHPWPQFVKLLILTIQRRSEVAGIRRVEVNLTDRLWTIPKDRAKNGIEHAVPLSPEALAILKSCPVIGDGGFYLTRYGSAGVSGFSKAKIELDAEILRIQKAEAAERGEDPDDVTVLPRWTWHDLRRTGVSGLSRLGVALPVSERLVNHISGSFAGVVGVYNRHKFEDEIRAALDAWAQHVMGIVNG